MKLQLLWHWLEWELRRDLGSWSCAYWQFFFYPAAWQRTRL